MIRILASILVVAILGVFGYLGYRRFAPAKSSASGEIQQAANEGDPSKPPEPNSSAPPESTPRAGENAGTPQIADADTTRDSTGQTAEQPIAPQNGAAKEADPFGDLAASESAERRSKAPDAVNSGSTPDQKIAAAATSNPNAAPAASEKFNPFPNEGGNNASPENAAANSTGPHSSDPNSAGAMAPAQNGALQSTAGPSNAGANPIGDASITKPAGAEAQTAVAPQTGQAKDAPSQNEPSVNPLLDEPQKTAAKDGQPVAPAASVNSSVAGTTTLAPGSTASFNPGQKEPAEAPFNKQNGQREPIAATQQQPQTADASGSASPFADSTGSTAQSAQGSSSTIVNSSDGSQNQNSPVENQNPKPGELDEAFPRKSLNPTPSTEPMPFTRSQPRAAAPAHEPIANDAPDTLLNESMADVYVVLPQDNLWTISLKKYGAGRYSQALAELNKSRIPDPRRMRPGTKIVTPPIAVLDARFGPLLKGQSVEFAEGMEKAGGEKATGAKLQTSRFFIRADGRPMYRIGDHDTLADIAAQHLGRASRSIQIFEMNRDKLSNPNELKVGTELVLPADASNVAVLRTSDVRR